MNKIQQKKPDWKWLFRNFSEANKAVKMIRKRAIIMLGLTRVGKSTLYNLIINPQSLIGKQIEANCYYVPTTFGGKQINPAAKISHRMVSETLLPNMRNITQNNEEITLIDMPGAGQRREGSKVLLTSYALTTVFENLKDAKFILVMTQSSFLSIADNCFRNTFQEFLYLFNFKEMKPEVRDLLFKSVSLVITSVRPALANKLLGQLSLNLKNLKELYIQNKQYMPNFDYCQMLINSLIQSNRVQPFLLAEHGVPPPKSSTFISSLNNKRWRYCEMSKIIKQVEYPYIRYFRLFLNQKEQKQVESLISTRFNQLQSLHLLLDDLILRIKDNICNKNVDIKPILDQIYKKFIQGDYYMDTPRNNILRIPNVVNLKDRIQKILLIQNHNKKLKLVYEWRAQMNAAVQSQQQIPTSVYYEKYLLAHFNQGIQHVVDLCCSQEAAAIFTQIQHIFNKLFFQASNLDCLRKGSDLKDFNLRSILQNSINQYLFLIREEDENISVMNIFNQFYHNNFTTSELSFQQIEDIIKYFFTLEQKYPELDSIQVYKLLYKLKNVKIQKIQKEVKKDREKQIMRAKLEILYYATRHIISLLYVQHASDSDRIIQTLHFQRAIASDMIRILYAMGGPMLDFAHDICEILGLYKDKSFLFQKQMEAAQNQQQKLALKLKYRLVQKNSKLLDAILKAASYEQKIGNTTKCIQLYEKYKKEGGRFQNGFDPIIFVRNNAQSMIETSQKCKFEQERTPLKSQKVFQCLRLCFSHIFNVNINWPFNIEEIGSAYRAKMAQLNQQGQINKQLPKNPEPIQLIEQCTQMIKICKDKKLTILLGSRRFCGLTTLSYALHKKRLINFENGKYQLEINSKTSKINHNPSSPNQFPNIFKINEEEWIIDFPNIFPYDPQISLIKGSILEKFIRQSSGFRIILVTNQEGFLQSQSAQLIRLLKFIMKVFPKNQFKFERALGFAVTMSSTGPEHVKNFRVAQKLLLSRFQNLKGNQMQVIENQKKFKLSYAEQMEVNQILKVAISKGARLLKFEKPNSGQQQNMTNFLEQVTKNGEYIERQLFKELHSIKIEEVIQDSFEESESVKIIGTIQFLITQINQIFQQISKITDPKLDELIDGKRSFPPQFHEVQSVLTKCLKITNKSKQIQATNIRYQEPNQLQKMMICYRDIIQHLTNDYSFWDYMLPDDCVPLLNYIEGEVKKLFKKIISFVCSNDADTVPIVKAQCTVYIFLNYLRWICGSLVFSKGKIRQAVSTLRKLSDNISRIFDIGLTRVILSFKMKIFIVPIIKLSNNEQKYNCLIYYNQILNMISNGNDSQQYSEMKKMAIQSLRELLQKNGKSKQLCLILLEEIQLKMKQTIERIDQIEDLLRNVSENIVLLHPKLGLQICHIIGCLDTKQILCQKIIDYSADQRWKLQAYIQLYIILQNRGAKMKLRKVNNDLLAFIGNNHPDLQLLSSPNGVMSKALKFQANIFFEPNIESILSITSYIKQQINTI